MPFCSEVVLKFLEGKNDVNIFINRIWMIKLEGGFKFQMCYVIVVNPWIKLKNIIVRLMMLYRSDDWVARNNIYFSTWMLREMCIARMSMRNAYIVQQLGILFYY
ncbi:unnamed protein product [Musa textilis]